MAITNGYCTLMELREFAGIEDGADDARLELAIEAASRAIDRVARRRFWVNSVDETRYYQGTNSQLCWIDDLSSITSLATDDAGARTYGTTWASTDYDLWPDNAATIGDPYMVIQTTPTGRYRFPNYPRSVRVVGKFGVPAVSPWQDAVKQATLIHASRLFKRKDSPLGVAGVGAVGQTILITDIDPDVRQLIAPPITRLFN